MPEFFLTKSFTVKSKMCLMSKLSSFELKRNYTRNQLEALQDDYLLMLNETILIDSEKQRHLTNFTQHFQFINEWLRETNSLFYCKLNYSFFLSHMRELAEECKVIYFGIALLSNFKENIKDRKSQRHFLIDFFSTYNIQIEFDFFDRIHMKRKELADKSKSE